MIHNRVTGMAMILSLAAVASADIIQKAKSNPNNPLGPAIKLITSGKVDEAGLWLKKHVETAKDQPHHEIILSTLLRDQGKRRESLEILDALAASKPDRMDVRITFAEIAISESRWFEATIHLEAAEKAKPANNWTPKYTAAARRNVMILRATCYEARGRWAEAKKIYASIVQQAVPEPANLIRLARSCLELKEVEHATKLFARAHALDQSQPPPNLAIATHYARSGAVKEAEHFFRKAVSPTTQTTDRSRSQLAFGQWLIRHNRADEVESILPKPLDTEDGEKGRSLLLAMAARMQGRTDVALRLLSKLHQAESTNFLISNQLALVLIESDNEGYRARAQQIAESNARNHPGMIDAWSTLGWVQFRLGDVASARQNLTRATAAGVISRDTAWHLAKVHEHSGNKAEAERFLAAVHQSKGPFFNAINAANGSAAE